MGLFSSALNGAVEGAQEMVLLDTFDRYQDEINVLNEYVNLLSYGAQLYRAIARGQIISATKNHGNYHAAREVMKKRCNAYPEEDNDFLILKKRFVEEYAKGKFKKIKEAIIEDGYNKIYANVDEIRNDKMNFITLDELIRRAMTDPADFNPADFNRDSNKNDVSPFGPFPSKEEKKKEKSSYWLFGKK